MKLKIVSRGGSPPEKWNDGQKTDDADSQHTQDRHLGRGKRHSGAALRDRVKIGAILVNPKNSWRINRREIQREKSCAKLTTIEEEQTAGVGSHQRRGVGSTPVYRIQVENSLPRRY